MPKKYELKIKVTVDQSWIDDGFDMFERKEEIEEKLRELIPYAYEREMLIEIEIKEK